MFKFNSILVPTDFSIGFEVALNYAKEIAKSMDSVLHIVHVVEPGVFPPDFGFSHVSFVDIEKELEKNAANDLASITGKLTEEGYNFRAEILFGKASDQIIDYCQTQNIELICIATHGRSGFEHLLFGSTTERVMRKATCPVLAVRLPKSEWK